MKKTKKIIVANWKMNPESTDEAQNIAKATVKSAPKSLLTIICPPFTYLSAISKYFKPKQVALGAQNVFTDKKGAYTGEISAGMLKSLNVSYAIIGHSERRALGETDETVAKKILCAWNAEIIPILCVGEKKRDDHGEYLQILKSQITASLSLVPKAAIKDIVLAYEPIWAIGLEANNAMNERDLHETSIFIRKVLVDAYGLKAKETKILYGGSVAPENAAVLVKEGEVDGLLVGHISLKPKAFTQILKSVSEIK